MSSRLRNERSPTRRAVLEQGAWLAGAMVLHGATRAQETARKERPNLVFLCSDQQHFQALGCADPFFETPELDRFASESLVFEKSFCSTPLCSPSRSSMLTGLYPHKTGVMNNIGQRGGAQLARPTVAVALRAAGYRTAYFGKWHLGANPVGNEGWDEAWKKDNDPSTTRRGLDHLRRWKSGDPPFALFLMYLDPHDIYMFQSGERPGPTDAVPVLDESWEKETLENKPVVQQHYMRNDSGENFVDAPRETWESFRLFYRERVKELDENLAPVLAELRGDVHADRTAVFFSSDHGEMDTRHRMVLKGPFMYEHVVRIPTIARLPEAFGGRGPRVEREHCWVNVDLVPTLLELAGLQPEEPVDGRSAVPVLRGAEGFEPRRHVIGQFHGKGRWVCPIRMLRTPRYKYNLYRQWGEELYDLEQDPLELVNLAASESAAPVKAELRAELEAWMKANADPFETLEVSELRRESWRDSMDK